MATCKVSTASNGLRRGEQHISTLGGTWHALAKARQIWPIALTTRTRAARTGGNLGLHVSEALAGAI
jgi:hypothetical protein